MLAFLLSRLVYPTFPEVVGVLRCVERPTFESLVDRQIDEVIEQMGAGTLDELFAGEDTWLVE